MLTAGCRQVRVFVCGLDTVDLSIGSLSLRKQISSFPEFYHKNEINLPPVNSKLTDINKNTLQSHNSIFKYLRNAVQKTCEMHLAQFLI